jgi:hypothetical protein
MYIRSRQCAFASGSWQFLAQNNAWPGFARAEWPIVRNHTDPTDILKPQVYEIESPAWADPRKENKRAMREFCN